MIVFLAFLVSTSYINTIAQLPQPTTARWYVKEGDVISWYVTKFREFGNVISRIHFFNNTSGETINVTEGDTITITVLTLGNASENEGTCRIQVGEEQLSTRLAHVAFFTSPLIFPVYDRDYWVDLVELMNQTSLVKWNLEGNLLTINSSSSSSNTVIDISTGLTHIVYVFSSGIEYKIDLTGFFPNISLPTLLLIGVIGVEIIVAIFLVWIFRRRRLELS